MKGSTPKEKALKKIRDALVDRMPPPFSEVNTESSVFKPHDSDFQEEVFAKALIKADGKFIFCSNVEELISNFEGLIQELSAGKIYYGEDFLADLFKNLDVELTNNIEDIYSCDVAVTGCEALVARHGSIICSSNNGGRKSIVAAPVHIVIAAQNQLVYSIKDAIKYLNSKYNGNMPSIISFITGPSRTADIEKTLIYGAHGPKELYLFMFDMQ